MLVVVKTLKQGAAHRQRQLALLRTDSASNIEACCHSGPIRNEEHISRISIRQQHTTRRSMSSMLSCSPRSYWLATRSWQT
eukprot:2568510-Amphidinium_carterae.1